MDDNALLEQYARSASESAFASLVERHIGLVYSAALRQVHDPHHAEDVTQAVFIVLARKAEELSLHPGLSGWLLQTTRYAANAHIRCAIRRTQREQEAAMRSELNDSSRGVWEQLEPLLDEAMASLGTTDRAVLALRYFENRTAAEIGGALKLNEEAAKKRANRALEKLRKFFLRRGVALSATAIAGAVSANSVQAAPPVLANSVSAVAIAKGATAGSSTLSLVKGALKIMTWKQIKLAAITGVAILATGAAGVAARQMTQGNAKIPYIMLDDAVQFMTSVNQSNLTLRMSFWSKQASNPTNIHLTIESKSRGSIPVRLSSDGQLLDLPHDEDLRRENPFVVSDLPKGSLQMTVVTRLPKPKEPRFPYSRLADGIAEINQAVLRANRLIKERSYAKEMLPFKKQVQGVVFLFPPKLGRQAKVEIVSATGRREYTADNRGQIKLRIEKPLLSENPEVRVSHNSYTIIPDLE